MKNLFKILILIFVIEMINSCTKISNDQNQNVEPTFKCDYKPLDQNLEDRQMGVKNPAYAVEKDRVSNLKYFIHSSILKMPYGSIWVLGADSAAVMWTGISNCRVKFLKTTNIIEADIIISSDNPNHTLDLNLSPELINLPDKVTARTVSTNVIGRAAKNIAINDLLAAYPFKKSTICHELGHSILFKHTDIPATSDPNSAYISQTPLSDAQSIMNSVFSASNPILNFSSSDILAARLFYPDLILALGGFNASSKTSSTIDFAFTKPTNSYPVYWIQVEITSPANIISNKFYLLTDIMKISGLNKGLYKIRIKGLNYRKDVSGDWTSYLSVTVI